MLTSCHGLPRLSSDHTTACHGCVGRQEKVTFLLPVNCPVEDSGPFQFLLSIYVGYLWIEPSHKLSLKLGEGVSPNTSNFGQLVLMRHGASTAVHTCSQLPVFTGWIFKLVFRSLCSHFPVNVGDLLLGYTGGCSWSLGTTQLEILRQLDSTPKQLAVPSPRVPSPCELSHRLWPHLAGLSNTCHSSTVLFLRSPPLL